MEKSKVRIGIVGSSMIAHKFAAAARESLACELSAVYSRSVETGRTFAEQEKIKRVETDLDAFLASPDIDAVYIASPNALHERQARLALTAGKHVLLEKPTVPSVAEYLDLAKMADERNLVFMEAMRPLHNPLFSILRDAICQLGVLRRVDFEYCQYSSRYDRFRAGELPNAFDPSLSNAALMDIGVYPIALLVALFGLPDEVKSESIFLENGFEGAGEVICRYPGMLATVSYSKITDSVSPSVITGERGSLLIDRVNGASRITLRLRGESERDLRYLPKENDRVYEIVDFCRAGRGEKLDFPFSEYSLATVKMLELVRRQNKIVFPSDRI